MKNAFFLEELSPAEQLVVAGKCDNYIISNSTFSWWAAWLGEKDDTKIVRPFKNLAGQFAKENDDRDYFPERWITFDHRGKFVGFKYLNLFVYAESFRLLTWARYQKLQLVLKTKKRVKRIIGKK